MRLSDEPWLHSSSSGRSWFQPNMGIAVQLVSKSVISHSSGLAWRTGLFGLPYRGPRYPATPPPSYRFQSLSHMSGADESLTPDRRQAQVEALCRFLPQLHTRRRCRLCCHHCPLGTPATFHLFNRSMPPSLKSSIQCPVRKERVRRNRRRGVVPAVGKALTRS